MGWGEIPVERCRRRLILLLVLYKYSMKEVCPMAENKPHKQTEKSQGASCSLTDTTTYDFDKNSFVVEPVFKDEKSETLGTVLLRLMTKKG